jgi:AIG2-like family
VLDHWDGPHPGYFQKLRVRVQTLDGDEAAWPYVLNDYEGSLPSARYAGIVADAAELAGAPAGYVAGLRARPCTPLGG